MIREIIKREERKQREKIILIPSESCAPLEVRRALGSVFNNLYAEGYPSLRMEQGIKESIEDLDEQLSYYRRYSDRRYYKGVEYADLVESITKKRIAGCFANERVPADRIFANIQPLSGALANNAVYEAFLQPGDKLMGMDLFHGGHLTHGSPLNRSGKHYRVATYGTDEKTGRLDYKTIRDIALKERPAMIIAGYSSYPWAPDWKKLRNIAHEAGAYLMADIAHPAGLVIAGVYPSPLGYADVITFTTHKTLLGPRGAVILTTDEEKARVVERAIFPGEQGGPHVNKFAAIGIAFSIARSEEFRATQGRIVENARCLAEALKREGLKIAYGGTDTHLLVIDLKGIKSRTSFPLRGEPASRILDLAGIVTNRNTLPGDEISALATGIRIGTPWVTQLGMGKREMRKLARLIAKILTNIHPFSYVGLRRELPRGKIDHRILEDVKQEAARLIGAKKRLPKRRKGTLEIAGERVTAFLQGVTTNNTIDLKAGQSRNSFLLDRKGKLIDAVSIKKLKEDKDGRERYLVTANDRQRVKNWLEALSDGYVLFDEEDVFAKIEGPVVIRERSASRPLPPSPRSIKKAVPTGSALFRKGYSSYFSLPKTYFIGQKKLGEIKPPCQKTEFAYTPRETEIQKTPLYSEHEKSGSKMGVFAGWEMPLWYKGIREEHLAVRKACGLFDIGHMGIIGVEGPDPAGFLDLVSTNYVKWLKDGQCQYSFLLDPGGEVIDDIVVYRAGPREFMLVVNAVNFEKDILWLEAVRSRKCLIDLAHPHKEFLGEAIISDLKGLPSGKQRRTGLALQGPDSLKVLSNLIRDGRLAALKRMEFLQTRLAGVSSIVSRSGYTGESLGYEIYLPPAGAGKVWRSLIEKGATPCGLGARDSLRTEAGLPLYGQELGGEHHLSPQEAGFASYVRFHKPYFIGRDACLRKSFKQKRAIVRFLVREKGVRAIRKGYPVLAGGRHIGRVTSSSLVEEGQIGLAYVEKTYSQEGKTIRIETPPLRGEKQEPEALILPRFSFEIEDETSFYA